MMTDEDIIQSLKQKIEEHQSFIEKYKQALSILITEDAVIPKSIPNALGKPVIKGTFKSVVLDISKDEGCPLTAKDLRTKFNSRTGKNMSTGNFSGQLSLLVKNGHFKKIKYPEKPIEERFEYALTEWFDGDIIKEEHKKSQ